MTRGGPGALARALQEWIALVGDSFPLLSRPDLARFRAGRKGPPPGSLPALAAAIEECRGCRLGSSRRRSVPGEGEAGAPVFLVGEAPGGSEEEAGGCFHGPEGELLARMIRGGLGLDLARVFVTYVVKCRPPEDRDPEAGETEACRLHLESQLRAVGPRVVLGLGRLAALVLAGVRTPLGSLRGRELRFLGLPLVLSWSPRYLLQHPEAKGEAWQDLLRALDLAGLPRPGRSR